MNKKQEYEATVKFSYPGFEGRFDMKLMVDYTLQTERDDYIMEVLEKVKEKKFPIQKHNPAQGSFNYAEWQRAQGKKKNKEQKLHKVKYRNTGGSAVDLHFESGELAEMAEKIKARGNADKIIQKLSRERLCTKCMLFESEHYEFKGYACDMPNFKWPEDVPADRLNEWYGEEVQAEDDDLPPENYITHES